MTKFRQIFFILISGILVGAPVAFAAHRDDNSHQPSVEELAEPLCKGLKAGCQSIVDSIDRISAQDRVSVCDYARRLITSEMSGDDRGRIIEGLAIIPAFDRDGFISAAQRVFTPTMDGYYRAVIISALERVSAPERDGVMSAAKRLFNPKMGAPDYIGIISALAAVPAPERDRFISDAQRLFTPAMENEYFQQSARTQIIQSLASVPAPERDDFISDAERLLPSETNGSTRDANVRAAIISALAAVPAHERNGFSSAAQRLFTSAMDGSVRLYIITVLVAVPAHERAARATETLRLYREAETRGETQGAGPNVMLEILRNHAHPATATPGRAFEVHNYADTQVAGPADAGPSDGARCESPKTKRLNDAVLEGIQERLTRGKVKTLEFSRSFAAVNALAEKLYSGQELATAKAAIARGLESEDAQRELCQVYAFVRHFHPAQLQLWAKQFIGESITAYEDAGRPSGNAASCTKGITERIVIGLRGIDPELDKLFGQAEGPASMKILLAQSNFRESSQHATWMSKKLVALGATPQTTPEEMGQLYKAFLERQLKEYGLEDNKGFEGQADTFAELIEGDLEGADSHLKHALAAEFAKMSRKKGPAIAPRKKSAAPSRDELRRRAAEAAEKRRKQNEGAGPAD